MTRALRPAAGEFDQRVTLQVRQAGQDERGQPTGAWVDAPEPANVWARIRPAFGRDYEAAQQQQATLEAVLQIRWRAGVESTWRVLWRGEPYELIGEPVDVDGGRHTLDLRLTRGVRDGR